MPKLHELLAVDGQLKGQAEATRKELRNTFDKKRHLFEEKRVTFKSNDEGASAVTEQQSDLQSTVPQELSWIADLWSKPLDVSYQVAEANMKARADVVMEDGTMLLTNVPATALLELEKRAGEIQDLLMGVPTLDPAKGFTADTTRGANIFKARDISKTRTKKDIKVITLAPATEQHPAQAQMVNVDVATGSVLEQEWSGLITPARKAELLERIEAVRRAIKQARQRANDVEMAKTDLPTCGKAIFDYVLA